jgi:hypothetical protein
MNGKICKIQFMGDGLRYRRKRKYQDIDSLIQDEQILEKAKIDQKEGPPNPQEEISKKSKKLKQTILNTKENSNPFPKEESKKFEKIQIKFNKVIAEEKFENTIKKDEEIELEKKYFNNFTNPDSDIKKTYKQEVEKAIHKVNNYQNYFLNESLPLMGEKIKASCINNSRTLKDFKCKFILIIKYRKFFQKQKKANWI